VDTAARKVDTGSANFLSDKLRRHQRWHAKERKKGRKGAMERLDVNKLREEFNRASEFVRIVTLLSPT